MPSWLPGLTSSAPPPITNFTQKCSACSWWSLRASCQSALIDVRIHVRSGGAEGTFPTAALPARRCAHDHLGSFDLSDSDGCCLRQRAGKAAIGFLGWQPVRLLRSRTEPLSQPTRRPFPGAVLQSTHPWPLAFCQNSARNVSGIGLKPTPLLAASRCIRLWHRLYRALKKSTAVLRNHRLKPVPRLRLNGLQPSGTGFS